MRLKPEQIPAHCARNSLAPVYLLSGDEPLQLSETADALRSAARRLGHEERLVFEADGNFDWNSFSREALSISLFANQRLLEIRLPSGRAGNDGSAALLAYTENPPADTILLITTGKIDAQAQKTKWVMAVEKAGVFVPIWPIDATALPGWLQQRARNINKELTADAAAYIAERTEGNLLAAHQELTQLALSEKTSRIELETVLTSVSDSSRYQAFDLVDAVLSGDAKHALQILHGLRGEGAEPLAIAGALKWQVRQLYAAARASETGQSTGTQGQSMKRTRAMTSALSRLNVRKLRRLIQGINFVETSVKGLAVSDPWQVLSWICLCGAGLTPAYRPLSMHLALNRAH
jgi:DNA polymerase-3 subunit delta